MPDVAGRDPSGDLLQQLLTSFPSLREALQPALAASHTPHGLATGACKQATDSKFQRLLLRHALTLWLDYARQKRRAHCSLGLYMPGMMRAQGLRAQTQLEHSHMRAAAFAAVCSHNPRVPGESHTSTPLAGITRFILGPRMPAIQAGDVDAASLSRAPHVRGSWDPAEDARVKLEWSEADASCEQSRGHGDTTWNDSDRIGAWRGLTAVEAALAGTREQLDHCHYQITRMSREKESAAKQVQDLLANLLAAHENATQRVGQWQTALQDDGRLWVDTIDAKIKLL
ncbi:hypothetical protein WJX84_010088 [Apatococcus fuscideae]|uniref:Uncharacterized protein n=1 Tax=Apatococcus fuscideae TaxID=2026836 RepID=A0AAW1SNL6_9CHLO